MQVQNILVKLAKVSLLSGLLVSSFACKPQLLPNTSIKDNSENRAIMAFIEEYRKAVESHRVENIMALVAPDYADKADRDAPPTILNTNDLKNKLEQSLGHVKEVTLSMHVQNVERDGDNFKVVYYYVEHALVTTPSGDQWMTASDVNRIVLHKKSRREGGGFEIRSGL